MKREPPVARIMAGAPKVNATLYHRIRFAVIDPVVFLEWPVRGRPRSVLIVRDIELPRARKLERIDRAASPDEFQPEGGLSGDRETAAAQAAAECLRRAGITRAVADRSLPLLFAEVLRAAGIAVECDPAWGLSDRRAKDEQELAWLRAAQQATERAMERACTMVARATAGRGGVLMHEGAPLTAERVRAAADHLLLDEGYENPPAIVAPGRQGADCHALGAGPIRTGEPVIIDIFPRNRETLYCGDCTRTVVHGDPPDELVRMHAAVCRAKRAAIAAVRASATGEAVHRAALKKIHAAGYESGMIPNAPEDRIAMIHGTGHGVGLDVHEPPLLTIGGPPLVAGDVVTIEPGLYCERIGGVRVEDMVLVGPDGCENFNRLPEGLDWR